MLSTLRPAWGGRAGAPPGHSRRGHGALGRAHAAGRNPAYGTDLLGGMHRHQARELAIRAQTIPP